MFELHGKHNTCKVFTDNCDNETISQITELLNQESVKGSQIRIMPDTHAGKGCVIGTTMTLTDKVIPNLVGVDIGCFTGDTEVWCATHYKTIKELAEKNEPLMTESFELDRYAFVYSKATAFKTRENAELVAVTFGHANKITKSPDDVTVRCTPDHKFLTCMNENNGAHHYRNETFKWVEAADLKKGMRLIAEDAYIEVKNVQKLDEREDVYCLNVPDCHNFSIKYGVIVHNCGMFALKLEESEIDCEKLDKVIRQYVPSGFSIHDRAIATSNVKDIVAPINVDKAMKSLGTLGGGNHFIEVDRGNDGKLWLVIHTGSRHLGIEVCKHYQDLAYDKIKNNGIQEKIDETVKRLKAENKHHEIENTIKILRMQTGPVPKDLCYVEGDDFKNYIHDMKLAQEHAAINRETIANQIIKHMDWHIESSFQTIHNYIDIDNMILRKGSVSAQKDETLIIPMNMRDGSLICVGKGNPDWNYSAPHGAGRIMSRGQAKQNVSMAEFEESMKGIYTTSVTQSTIDESPMVYKPMQEIIDNICDTVDIIDIIKPIYNFKASDA